MTLSIGLVGAEGALGGHVAAALTRAGADVRPLARGAHSAELPTEVAAVAVAVPWGTGPVPVTGVPVVGASLRPVDPAAGVLPSAGWFGGIGTLLAARGMAAAAEDQDVEVTEVHVAYAVLPGIVRAWSSLPPGLRGEVVDVLLGGTGSARRDGMPVPEPVAEARRLAWFPRPVGPWHAVAVPGIEASVLDVPTVQTWLAFGSLGAEALQAVGRADPTRGLGRLVHRRLARPGKADGGSVRWAVVAEVRSEDGTVHRAWANGTDPVLAAGELVAASALAAVAHPGAAGLLDLGPPERLLDGLADADVLRWSVARPTPSVR